MAGTAEAGAANIFASCESQPFQRPLPAGTSGSSNLDGLQTPDLVSYIDVTVFGSQRGEAPVISPHLLSAVTAEHGGYTGDSKRTRESNPFQTSFESLMGARGQPGSKVLGSDVGGGLARTSNAPGVRRPKGKSGLVSHVTAIAQAAANVLSNAAGAKKRNGSFDEDPDDSDMDRLSSKRSRNRLAAKNCRQRKIDKESGLEHELAILKTTHVALLERFNKLTSEVKALQANA